MRIQRIENNNVLNNKNTMSFKGSANGKYYEDWIIKEAKEAMHNPNWKDKFLKKKKEMTNSTRSVLSPK